jgi:hypothetical protein
MKHAGSDCDRDVHIRLYRDVHQILPETCVVSAHFVFEKLTISNFKIDYIQF